MKFLKENWYKLMTGTAMLIFACGFFINTVGPSYASQTVNSPSNKDYALVPLNKDGSIDIKISEEQLEKLIPAPMNKIGDYWYIGTGSGIYYTRGNPAPTSLRNWHKVQ